MVRRPLAAALAAALLGSGLFVAAAPVTEAAAKPRTFATCADLNKVYPHGVGRTGARDLANGKPKARPVKNFKVDTATYTANKGRDRDKDGIACEK